MQCRSARAQLVGRGSSCRSQRSTFALTACALAPHKKRYFTTSGECVERPRANVKRQICRVYTCSCLYRRGSNKRFMTVVDVDYSPAVCLSRLSRVSQAHTQPCRLCPCLSTCLTSHILLFVRPATPAAIASTRSDQWAGKGKLHLDMIHVGKQIVRGRALLQEVCCAPCVVNWHLLGPFRNCRPRWLAGLEACELWRYRTAHNAS